ncbi:MAG TPA: thiamine phosphate synthase [Candidatus Tumulicola sp.]
MAPQLPALTRAARVALLHGPYAIVNEGRPNPVDIAAASVRAGMRVVQYRAKHGIDAERLRAVRELTAREHALLILNDDVEAAIAFDCDGVHLGPDDGAFDDVRPIRERMGQRLMGISAGTVDEACWAERAGADYIGVGAVYATTSKNDAGAPIGIDALRSVAAASSLPIAAIGGIGVTNIAEVAGTGVAMAAVISAIAAAPDAERAAHALVEAWNGARR